MQIGIRLTTLLEKFHSLGYVYNDLKPDNICVGHYTAPGQVSDQHKIFLIDFGLASKYQRKDSLGQMEHVKNRKSYFKGNLAYASQHALIHETTGRRDDILSLLFLLYNLLTGEIFGKPEEPCNFEISRLREEYQ